MNRTSLSEKPSSDLHRRALVVGLCLALASVVNVLPSALATTATGLSVRGPAATNARSAQRARLFNHGNGVAVRTAPRPTVTSGAVLPVSHCLDDGSSGSLRAVVAAAANGDTVDLSALTCGHITLVSGEIAVAVDQLTINGPGSNALTIDGDHRGRVIAHGGAGRLQVSALSLVDGRLQASGDVFEGGCLLSKGDVELHDVTISGCRIDDGPLGIGSGLRAYGDAFVYDSAIRDTRIEVNGAAGGSAIAVEGDLVLSNSQITGNTVQITDVYDYGYVYFGAVNLWGKLTMSRSTISGNSSTLADPETPYAFVWGGGVTAQGGGRIVESTIDNNSTRDLGGGITLGGGNVDTRHGLEIISTTISGNAAHTGAGIMVRPEGGWVAIRSSTIAGNFAETGGGIYFDEPNYPLVVELQNNLIANNIATIGADIAKSNRLTLYGANNLIVDAQAGIWLPADTLSIDPTLLPLANNGGPTRTHALGKDSAAIDAGNDYFELGHDQRGPGFSRVVGREADIGALEMQTLADPVERIFADGVDRP